jgi:5-methylcytosine-specific restriction endonuclease McrA
MASFVGTKEEFKRYIGPMLRNLVQQLTRKYKSEVGKCEHCGSVESLEAAHVHGKDRNALIDNILDDYTYENIITIDLSQFEQHFRKGHRLIDETILILCRKCHSKYDSQSPIDSPRKKQKEQLLNNKSSKGKRLFSNREIQSRISASAKHLPSNELDKLCDPISKEIFNISYELFLKVPKNMNEDSKRKAVKDSKGINRWTWKFEFEKGGFIYAITTQWFEKSDILVKNWLNKMEKC